MLNTYDLDNRLEELNDISNNIEDLDEQINELDETILTLIQEGDLDEAKELRIDRENLKEERSDYYTDYDHEEHQELKELERNVTGWNDGITLIPETEIDGYLEDLLHDIDSDVLDNIPSYIVIDMEATIDNLRDDYSCVDYQGTEYWFLS